MITFHAPTATLAARAMPIASPMDCAGPHGTIYFGHPVVTEVGPLPTAPDTVLMVSRGFKRLPQIGAGQGFLFLICFVANPFSGKVMSPCNYAGKFACDYDQCAKENFTVSKGQVILRDYQQSSLGVLITVTANATTGASVSTLASSSTSTSTSSSLAKDKAPCVPSSSSSFSPNSSFNQSSKLAAVGAGVGVPFAIALVTALVLLGRERRKARRLEREIARLGGIGGSGKPVMVGDRESTASYQQSNPVGNVELVGARAEHELTAQPVAYELQTHGR